MAGPHRLSRVSQFWLPSLLFVLSVVSILFTLRNDEIPVLGPNERNVLDASDIDASRATINQALRAAGSWRSFCEHRNEALQAIHVNSFDTKLEDPRWSELRRHLPQREQDALLRCQNTVANPQSTMNSCVYLLPKVASKNSGLYVLELSWELRANGRKKILTCAEALAGAGPVEWVAWYSYYWTPQTSRKPLRFERLTGGTRIFPPIAQNAERSTASSRP